MANDRRRRYLREQRARKARSLVREWSPGPGQTGQLHCGRCGLDFLAEMPLMGHQLEVVYLDKDGNEQTAVSTEGQERWGTHCPRCGGEAWATNAVSHVDAAGVRWSYFASTEEEKRWLHEVLDFLRDEPASVEAVIAELEAKGANATVLRALAEWVRAHQDALITALIPTLVTVLLHLLSQDSGLTAEQLDRILEEHRGGSSEQVVEPAQRANEPDRDNGRPDGRESSGDSAVGPDHESNPRQDENHPPARKEGRRLTGE